MPDAATLLTMARRYVEAEQCHAAVQAHPGASNDLIAASALSVTSRRDSLLACAASYTTES